MSWEDIQRHAAAYPNSDHAQAVKLFRPLAATKHDPLWHTPLITPEAKQRYTCTALSPAGDCTIYETRPRLCRRYASAELNHRCEYRACTWDATRPAEEEVMKKFEEIGRNIGAIVDEKNAAYGNAVAKVGEYMRLLYPDGIKPEQYDDALLLVRDFDKSCRIASGNKAAFGEDPWADKAGYAIRAVEMGVAGVEKRIDALRDAAKAPEVIETKGEVADQVDPDSERKAEPLHQTKPVVKAKPRRVTIEQTQPALPFEPTDPAALKVYVALTAEPHTATEIAMLTGLASSHVGRLMRNLTDRDDVTGTTIAGKFAIYRHF